MILKLLSYPRSLIGIILFPLHTILCSSSLVIANLVFENRKIEDLIVLIWARGSCWLFGVEVEVEGIDNLPEHGFIYVFNHTSFFDIFAMSGYLGSFRFGAKIELFKIPFFGWAMRRAGILPIARDRRDEVFKVYKEAELRLRAGERFALAPEGTRQESEHLGKFKTGPFIFAINSKAPIVPVVIKGAALIWPKGKLIPNWGEWRSKIILKVLPPVDATGYTLETRPELQNRVRTLMEPFFN